MLLLPPISTRTDTLVPYTTLFRSEADKLTLLVALLAVRTVVEQVRELLQPLAERKGLGFVFRVNDDVPPWLAGDADRIRQIMLNLATNAIKFTESGSVQLGVDWIDAQLRIVVSDTGPGLNAEQCQRIFARFEQADGALGRAECRAKGCRYV